MGAKYKNIQEKSNLFDSIVEIALIKLLFNLFFYFPMTVYTSCFSMLLKIELPKQ